MIPRNPTKIQHERHGLSSSAEYHSWDSMIQRCTNPKHRHFSYYGGRGISVYPDWQTSFKAFYSYIGARPTPKHTLDRYPNRDGNYEPGNVRWATWDEQAKNKRERRDTVRLTHEGETRSIAEWAKHLNLPYQVLYHQLHRHPINEVLSLRFHRGRRKGKDVKSAFLTEAVVREMRQLYATGTVNFSEIGRRFGLSRQYARAVILRRRWQHVN